MTQLKSTPGSQVNEACDLPDYYQPGDGGGGQFYWDPIQYCPVTTVPLYSSHKVAG